MEEILKYGFLIKGLVLVLLIFGVYAILESAALITLAKKNFNKIMRDLHDKNEKRVVQAEVERRQYGAVSRGEDGAAVRFFNMIDDKLVYSGLMVKYPWLSASTYIIITMIVSLLVLLLGILIGGFVVGFIFLLIAMFGPYILISNMAYKNYIATERQLVFFIDLVSSNASASSDLLTILESIAIRVSNPIEDALYRAVATAKLSGSSGEGIYQLVREIEYPLFKEFIRNLEICGKQDADYRNVAKDFAKQAEVQLKAIERQRAIFANARSEVILMMVMGVFLSWMTCNFDGVGLPEMLRKMSESLLGIVCLIVEVLIYASSLIYIMIGKRK